MKKVLIIFLILIGVFFKDMYYESLRPKTDEKTQKAIGNLGITIMSFLGIWFFSGVAYIFLYFFYYIDRNNAATVIANNLKIAQGKEAVNKLVNNIDTKNALTAANEVIKTAEGTLEAKTDVFEKSQLTQAQLSQLIQLQPQPLPPPPPAKTLKNE